MKKFFLSLVPLLTLSFFILIMNSGSFFLKPFGKDDRLYETVKKIETDVKEKNWAQAKEDIKYTEKAWKKIVGRIQFSVEREYMLDISGTLSRMKGGIESKEEKAIMEEIYYFYGQWETLAR